MTVADRAITRALLRVQARLAVARPTFEEHCADERFEWILAGSAIRHRKKVPPLPAGSCVMHEFGRPAFFGRSMENVCWASTGSGQASASASRITAQGSKVMTIRRVVVCMDLMSSLGRTDRI
jgi:hypothetical protein